jgi:hypothetical protein
MEQYIHLLIAKPDDFAPQRQQLAAFCQSLVDQRVVPNVDRLSVSTPSGQVRTVKNPFTGEEVSFPMYAHQRLQVLEEFEAASQNLGNYCLHLAGEGTPEIHPLPIASREPYSIAVRCHVTAVPHSTSSLYDDDLNSAQLVPYDRPCPEPIPFGYFTDPTTRNTIEVPDAGRARFWIEFELGKFLIPKVTNGNLSLLNPQIIAWAESQFGVPFTHGCHYF